MVAREQKEDLRLKGVARAVGVKIREKWVLFEDLEQNFCAENRLEETNERGFADADDAFDSEIHRTF